MNTLPRAFVAHVLPNPDSYQQLRRHWRELIQSKRKHTLSAAHHFIYVALLGKDWRKGFTPPTNPRKLANGGLYDWGLFHALESLHRPSQEAALLVPFDGLVTAAMLQQLRQWIPLRQAFHYQATQFSAGQFPFEAYTINV